MSNKNSSTLKKFKRQRRLGIELPGMGKPGALAKRNYPPGFKGPLARLRTTEYGTRLTEKQRVLAHYKIKEKQMRRFVKMSKKGLTQNWLQKLFFNLELRLDNVVFRAGYAKSISQARQLVRHGFVKINQKSATIPSMVVNLSDQISVDANWFENTEYLKIKDKPVLDLPHFLEKTDSDKGYSVTITNSPTIDDVPFALERGFIAEYYQKVKA